MTQVKALSNIQHDGVLYPANSVIDIEDAAQAQLLIDSDVAVLASDQDVAVAEAIESTGGGPKPVESKRLDKNEKEAARVAAENAKKEAELTPNIDWSRAKLDDKARELGLDPVALPNKQAVLEAIQAKES